LNIIKRVSFKIGEKKFAPYLKQIKESNAQIMIVYVANLEESANIIIEFAKLKSSMMYLGSPASQSNLALAKAKDSAEGITAIVDMFMGQTPASAKYHAAYKKEYGEEPDNIAPYVYDGIKLLARAISEVGPEKNKIRDAILKTKNYQGVMGTYRFIEKGDGLSTVGIVKIEHGKPKLVKTLNIQ
jgi:branched-chain amino acid transport system substrate-binding protein